MKTIKVKLNKAFEGQEIKNLLENWKIPRKERYLLEIEKRLTVNQEFLPFDRLVHEKDQIEIEPRNTDNDKKDKFIFGDASLADCLYEDENLIIVNKACGMKIHPNSPAELALQNHVAAYCQQPVYVVHRLDQETSGALLFAKNTFVLPILGSLLEERQISRSYLALVKGHFSEENFTIKERIGRDRHDSKKRIVSSTGKEAVTKVKVLESYAQTSLVECQLGTGRTHQIRVHLSYLGHPIIGDLVYGLKDKKEKRLMLHARKMTLTLPFSHEKLEVLAPSQSFEERCNKEKTNKS